MKRLLHTPLALLVWRIALLYAARMLCRAAFWVYNAALLGPPVWSELGQLVAGSLKFDTVSVVYADGVFILLSLLPLHRDRKSTRLNSSHITTSYAVFCLKKKIEKTKK